MSKRQNKSGGQLAMKHEFTKNDVWSLEQGQFGPIESLAQFSEV